MDLVSFLQLLLSGILLGGVYALLAAGLALCFGVLGLLNLAHGSFLVLAAYAYQTLQAAVPYGSALGFLLIPCLCGLVGFVTFTALLGGPYRRSPEDFLTPALLITLGLDGLKIQNQSIADIWNGPAYLSVRRQHLESGGPEICRSCDLPKKDSPLWIGKLF